MDWFDKEDQEIKNILNRYLFDDNYRCISNYESYHDFIGESIVTLYLLNRGSPAMSHNWSTGQNYYSAYPFRKSIYTLVLSNEEKRVFPFLKKYKKAIAVLSRQNKFSLLLGK